MALLHAGHQAELHSALPLLEGGKGGKEVEEEVSEMCVCIINEGQTGLDCAATGLTLSSMSALSVGWLKAYC